MSYRARNGDDRGNYPAQQSHSSNSQRQQQRPEQPPRDHGSMPEQQQQQRATKGLDHFKRGYQERADMREREFYTQRAAKRQERSNGGDLRDPWSNRDRVTIVYGLDCNRLLDEMEKTKDRRAVFQLIEKARQQYPDGFATGKAVTALISASARRRNTQLAYTIWDWLQAAKMPMNVFHYNAMIAVAATERSPEKALRLMDEMTRFKIMKNEVTFSSAITACEKKGDWRTAIDLLDGMEREGFPRTAIAYNAAISACEKGMVPAKACEVFNRMKREGIVPSVVTYSALISAAEKGGQWKLALNILEDMKRDGHRGNVIAYSAAISALAKGQQWELALQLFREIQSCGREPSIVTYNATMTALEKGLQWEKALDLFDEMKMRNLNVTVVSYGSAISACDKGLQYRQCLEFLDEMTEMGIQKNVIIFGAALSCMEKCCRADICFLLMERMRQEKVAPNVHIYNSAISACARSNLWEKGYELFKQMDTVKIARDVVTYNAVLDSVQTQIRLGRTLLEEGIEKGFYARVSRLTGQWFELDLHFMSLGGGEIALGWWFEECLVPYMEDPEKLKDVKSISIVTGYGKTRTRGRRHGDDGMRKRVKAMLMFMDLKEQEQPNLGRIHIDMEAFLATIKKNGGKIIFDLQGYIDWKECETTINVIPDAEQKIRPRYRPANTGSSSPPFDRIETDQTSPEYRLENLKAPFVGRSDELRVDSMERPAHGLRGSSPRNDGRDDGGRGNNTLDGRFEGPSRSRDFDGRGRNNDGPHDGHRGDRDGGRPERHDREPRGRDGYHGGQIHRRDDNVRADFEGGRRHDDRLGGNEHENRHGGRSGDNYENRRDGCRRHASDYDKAPRRPNGNGLLGAQGNGYHGPRNDPQDGPRDRHHGGSNEHAPRKRGYHDVEVNQPPQPGRGYDLEPDRQRRKA